MKYRIIDFRAIRTSAFRPHPDLPEYVGSTANADIEMMAMSVESVGVLVPVVVNSEYRVIDGWLRIRAAQKCGVLEVPAMIVETDDAVAAHAVLDIGSWKNK